ncbi:MAG: ABC transporter ATP-binding protein [Desulfobacterales bacterium]|nr:ABC transporter ATP-binding protein [Desulfobacterales bacterium]
MGSLLETVDLVTNFYTYEGVVKALNKVSLVIEPGSTFGLVGESGCGKSVTVRSVMRIVSEPGRVEGGKIIFSLDDDKTVDLLQQSEAFMQQLRGDRISMIFQEPNAALNPTMSIGDQISESFLFHKRREMCEVVYKELSSPSCETFWPLKKYLLALYGMGARDPNARALAVLDRIPLLKRWGKRLLAEAMKRSAAIIGSLGIPNPDQIVKQYPHQLSGGMKQRIVIAIALACSPVLLIADEATSNLDVTIQAQILDLLQRLKEDVISSILLITHDLGVVAETCDRVGVMYAGNLVEVGDIDDLFGAPLHPYTRALLEAVPKFSASGELASIDGNVPNLVSPPSGCRFHPRCPHVKESCKQAFPEMKAVKGSHCVACYLYNGEDAKSFND